MVRRTDEEVVDEAELAAALAQRRLNVESIVISWMIGLR
jgi:hypothetical protein